MTVGIVRIESTPLPVYDATVLRHRLNELPRDEIESDDAEVESVPAGTKIGDLTLMKESYERLRDAAIVLNADPERKKVALAQFVTAVATDK